MPGKIMMMPSEYSHHQKPGNWRPGFSTSQLLNRAAMNDSPIGLPPPPTPGSSQRHSSGGSIHSSSFGFGATSTLDSSSQQQPHYNGNMDHAGAVAEAAMAISESERPWNEEEYFDESDRATVDLHQQTSSALANRSTHDDAATVQSVKTFTLSPMMTTSSGGLDLSAVRRRKSTGGTNLASTTAEDDGDKTLAGVGSANVSSKGLKLMDISAGRDGIGRDDSALFESAGRPAMTRSSSFLRRGYDKIRKLRATSYDFGSSSSPSSPNRSDVLVTVRSDSGITRTSVGVLSNVKLDMALSRVRNKIAKDKSLVGAIPQSFHFLLSDRMGSTPIDSSVESSVPLRRCLNHDRTKEGSLLMSGAAGALVLESTSALSHRLGMMDARHQHQEALGGRFLSISENQLARLAPDAKTAYLTCRRIVRKFNTPQLMAAALTSNNTPSGGADGTAASALLVATAEMAPATPPGGGKTSANSVGSAAGNAVGTGSGGGGSVFLASDVVSVLYFAQDVARLAADAKVGSPLAMVVPWSKVVTLLVDLEDIIRRIVRRRGKFSSWWFAVTDANDLRDAVILIEAELRFAPTGGGSENYGGPQCAFRKMKKGSGPESAEAEQLRQRISRKSLSELTTQDNVELRREISVMLGVSDAELLYEIQNETKDDPRQANQPLGTDMADVLPPQQQDEEQQQPSAQLPSNTIGASSPPDQIGAATLEARGPKLSYEQLSDPERGSNENGSDPGLSNRASQLTRGIDRRRSEITLFRHRKSTLEMSSFPATEMGADSLEACLGRHRHLDDALVQEHMLRFTPGTRRWALSEFDEWVADRANRHRIFILAAAPGMGKTAIAAKIVNDRAHTVVGHHFCRHDDARFVSAKIMILSIAFQLAERFPTVATKIRSIIAEYRLTWDRLMSDSSTVSTIFTEFLEIPLSSVEVPPHQKYVIVIDGLDESESKSIDGLQSLRSPKSGARGLFSNTSAAPSSWLSSSPPPSGSSGLRNGGGGSSSSSSSSSTNEIVDVISKYFARIPPWLNIFITTRPALPILKKLRKFNATMLGIEEEENNRDIRTFFFAFLRAHDLGFGNKGSGTGAEQKMQAIVRDLVHKADGSFLYASMAADIVRSYSDRTVARKQLEEMPSLLAGLFQKQMDELDVSFSDSMNRSMEIPLTDSFRRSLSGGCGSSCGGELEASEASSTSSSCNIPVPSPEGEITSDNEDVDEESLLWQIMKVMIVSVEPLTETLAAALVGCTMSELESALSNAPAFVYVSDTSRIHFYHKAVKDWLIREGTAGLVGTPQTPGSSLWDSIRGGGSIRGFSAGGGEAGYGGGIVDRGSVIFSSGDLGASAGGSSSDAPMWNSRMSFRKSRSRMSRIDMSGIKKFMAQKCLKLLKNRNVLRGTVAKSGVRSTSFIPLLSGSKFTEERDYLLRYGIQHLCDGGMAKQARELLMDVEWLMARADDAVGIIRDCKLIEDGDQVIKLLSGALRLSMPALRKDPRQLAGQLMGRLLEAASEGRGDNEVRCEIVALLDKIRAHDFGFRWWCPVSATWDQAQQAFLRRLTGHSGAVQSVSWCSSDGAHVASGSWDNSVHIWNVINGSCEKILKGHTSSVWSVDWSPDGGSLASASLDKTVRLWNGETGECRRVLEGHTDSVWAVAWSTDGMWLASGSKDMTIRIWKVVGEADNNDDSVVPVELKGHSGWVYSVAWSKDSRRVVSGSTDNSIRIWEWMSKQCVGTFEGHSDWVRSVSFTRDDRRISSGSADRTVRIWDVKTGECEQVFTGHTDTVWSVANSIDGRYVASGSTDMSVRIWDVSTGRCVQVLEGHQGAVWSVTWSADGKRVASASTDKSVMIWDAETGKIDEALSGHSNSVWSVDLSSDGSRLVSGSADKTVRVWDTATGHCNRAFTGHTGPIWSVALSHDGRRIASGSTDNTASVYNIATGDRELVLTGHTNSLWCVAWSADSRHVMSGSRDKTVRIWDSTTGECHKVLLGHTDDVRSIAVCEDGERLASGSSDKTVRVWNLQSCKCESVVHAGGSSGILSVAWSPDGFRIATGSSDKVIRIWNWMTGECEGTLTGHTRRVNSVCWSPDGTQIASASTDKTVRVWNSVSGECQTTLVGHTGLGVYSVKWSTDGGRLVSGSTDKTVRIWDATSARCEYVLTGHTGLGIYSIAWSEDGQKVVSGSRDSTIQIWNASTGRCEQVLTGHTNWVCTVAWERGGRRIVSVADDDTVRIWDVVSGECVDVVEGARDIPADFDVATPSCITRDLSGLAMEGEPVGVSFEKVQVLNDRACAWTGRSVHFFKLITPNAEPPAGNLTTSTPTSLAAASKGRSRTPTIFEINEDEVDSDDDEETEEKEKGHGGTAANDIQLTRSRSHPPSPTETSQQQEQR